MNQLGTLILVGAIPLASQASAANVSYRFESPTSAARSFELVTNGFVTSDASFSSSAMRSCTYGVQACSRVDFHVDAYASGNTNDDRGWQTIVIFGATSGSFYYVAAPAFTTFGTHSEVFAAPSYALTVSAVPEPASSLLMLGGLLVLGVSAVRRHG